MRSTQCSWRARAGQRIARIAGSALLLGIVPIGTGLGAGTEAHPPGSPVERQWYHHAELAAPGLRAEPHHTVMLHLRSTGARGKLVRTSIPYLVRETASFNFCVAENEPHIRALTLVREDSPAVVVRVPRGRCKERTISAGLYRLHVDHDGRRVPPEGVTAFIHVPRRHDRPGQQAATGLGSSPPIPPRSALQFVPECESGGFNWSSIDHPLFTFMVNGGYLGSAMGTSGPLTTHATAEDSRNGWSVCWSFDSTRIFFNGVNPSNIRTWALAGSDHKTVVEKSGPIDLVHLDHQYFFYAILFDHAGQPFADWHFSLWGQNSHVEQGDIISQSSELHWAPIGWYGVANFNAIYKVYRQGATVPDPESGQAHLVTAPCGQSSGPTYVAWQDLPDLDAAGIRAATAVTIRPGPSTAVVAYPQPHYAGTPQYLGGGCLERLPASLALVPLTRTLVVSTNACRYCDLTGIDLGGVNLTGGDFTGSTFNGANLTGTNFQSAILDDAQFRSCQAATTLAGTNFLGAHLRCTDFGNSDLRSAEFWSASPAVGLVIVRDFSCRLRVQWAHVNLDTFPLEDWRYLYLDHAQIAGASGQTLSSAAHPLDLSNALLSGTKGLTDVGLAGADVTHAQFVDTDLTGATLSGAVLSGANFTDANLTGADLGSVVADAATPARFNRADLTRAYLANARLSGSFFRGAAMSPVNLAGADLSGAWMEDDGTGQYGPVTLAGSYMLHTNLSGAHLTNAILDLVSWYNKNPADPVATGAGALLTGASFNLADLPGLDLTGAHLQGATLTNAQLIGANLTGAQLPPDGTHHTEMSFANLRGANLTGANLTSANLFNAGIATTQESTVFLEVLKDPDHFQKPLEYEYFAVNRPATVLSGDTITTGATCPSGAFGPCGALTDPKWVAPVGPQEPSNCHPSAFDADGNVIAVTCSSDRHPAGG